VLGHHYVAVPDSDRVPRPGATSLGPANPTQQLSVTVYLRRDPAAPPVGDVVEEALVPPTRRTRLSDDRYATTFGAAAGDIAMVEQFAREHELEVVAVNQVARSVQLAGTVEALTDAFQVTLARYGYIDQKGTSRVYRGRVGAVHVPVELDGIVTAVIGLDDRPLGDNLLIRRRDAGTPVIADAAAVQLPAGTFLPTTLEQLYDFPAATDGTGECVAVLAFNGETRPGTPSGGYDRDALRTYFDQVLGIPLPEIVDVVVHGPGNEPGSDGRDADRADTSGEIMLDLQVVGALAPKAKIVVYFTVFTEQGWVDAINAIVTDTVHRPTVISCSYGNPEDALGSAWTRMAIRQVNQTFAAAAARGITICCASGDDGSRDQANDFRAHADYPASSPFVLGVGGTRLVAAGGQITSETVWNDGPGSATGGGISSLFPVPSWQVDANVPDSINPPHRRGRGVPDVAALADPRTGVAIISLDGQHIIPIGGTSAAAPLWAALVARINQALGAPVGLLNPLLYTTLHTGVLRDITHGSNGAYAAGTGWDACTGFGCPGGTDLLEGLQKL